MKKRVWQLSLASFIIAAFTGFLYRYGMYWPLPEGIGFANIRHAHSHLMFFNWVTPPVMVWMLTAVLRDESPERITPFRACLYTMLFLGFLSYPFFLFYGYHSVPIGSASLPLAAIISGLVMLTWYWFAWLWYRERISKDETLHLTLYDGALIALIISSLGAWGVSVFQFTDIDSPLISSAMTHFFLGVFTEGWVVLALLGIIWHRAGEPEFNFSPAWLWLPLLFGSMLVFPFSLERTIITPAMHLSANAGLILIAISLALHLRLFIRQNILKGFLMKTVAVLIAVKILFQLIAVLPVGIWPGEHGLRVLYLHLLLLGIVSPVLVEWFHPARDKAAKTVFTLTVLAVLVTLLFISGYWPPALSVPDVYRWVLIAAFLPGVPAVWLFFNILRR
jgi:hypothetical protein